MPEFIAGLQISSGDDIMIKSALVDVQRDRDRQTDDQTDRQTDGHACMRTFVIVIYLPFSRLFLRSISMHNQPSANIIILYITR